jgi:DinB superfamily
VTAGVASGQCDAMGLARSTVSLLDSAWPRVRGRLDGMGDDEYLWEPVPGCWSVRRLGERWEIEREVPPPSPAPVTTIAWRTWHIGSESIDGFLQLGFQTKALDLGEREWFPDAVAALAAMDTAWARFSDCYHGLDDEAMGRELGARFGPFAQNSWADLLLHVADELIHHGAEVALLRDLFAADGDQTIR